MSSLCCALHLQFHQKSKNAVSKKYPNRYSVILFSSHSQPQADKWLQHWISSSGHVKTLFASVIFLSTQSFKGHLAPSSLGLPSRT
jgi:hypothetical protein